MSLDFNEPASERHAVDISETESPSEAVVRAVAAVSGLDPVPGRSPDCLDPLYTAVDPDALDTLFRPGSLGRVTFHYHGYEVTVDSDGRVLLDARSESPA